MSLSAMRVRPVAGGIYFVVSLFLAALFLPPAGDAGPLDAPLQTAKARFEAGAYSASITALKDLLAGNPEDAEAHFWMARCHYELHDYDNSVEQAKRAVERDPKNSLYHQWLGRAYGGKADRRKSFLLARKVKQELEKAVELNPSNISARRDLQRFYMEAPWIVGGSRNKALMTADAIAAMDAVEGHLAHAEYYRQVLHNREFAEKEYLSVLMMKPAQIGPYLEIAEYYVLRENVSALESVLRDATSADPSDARLFFYRGVAGIISGSSPKAAQEQLTLYLSRPERSDWPSHAEAREWAGRLLEKQGNLAGAAGEYREALKTEPGRKETRARLDRLERSLKR
jgi:tetratricopeptide (TPR) repeat protein